MSATLPPPPAPAHPPRATFRWRGPWTWLALAACVLAGAALNVYRVSSWQSGGVHSPRDFETEIVSSPAQGEGRRISWARSYGKIEVFNQFWRPMRVTLTLRAPDDAPPEGIEIAVAADNRPQATFRLTRSWSQHTFVLSDPAPADGRLWLQLERPVIPSGRRGFAVARVETSPIFAARPVIVHGLIGAVLGAATWFLLSPRRWPRRCPAPAIAAVPPTASAAPVAPGASVAAGAPRPAAPSPPSLRVLAAVAGAIFLLFAAWASIRPPFQTPDEPQQHLRTTSILLSPWFAPPGRFPLDERYVSPLAFAQPRPISKLPFYTERRLSAAEIVDIKTTPWRHDWTLEPFERIYASYPTLYYLTLFGVAQPITALLQLSPYDSSFVYRFVTAALAALLWAAVYAALRRTVATRPLAGWIVAIAVINPMVTFLSSGVNADAVGMPLSTLAILAVWHVLLYGTHRGRALAALLAAALVKPSAGSLFIALGCAILVAWFLDWRRLAALSDEEPAEAPPPAPPAPWRALLVVGQAGILAAWGFYLWSPLLFANQVGARQSLHDFIRFRVHDTVKIAIEFWGSLGWLDYQIAGPWYLLLYVLVLVNLVCVIVRPRRAFGFVAFTGVVFLVVGATTIAGEFAYLPQAGYTLQGRYFLPAMLGFLAPVLWHRVPAARTALLAGVMLVNLLLAQKTAARYYDDGWRGVAQALPFRAAVR